MNDAIARIDTLDPQPGDVLVVETTEPAAAQRLIQQVAPQLPAGVVPIAVDPGQRVDTLSPERVETLYEEVCEE
jgi:hypothetical protein